MKVLKYKFGKSKSGEEVIKYTLINSNNLKISILNYGGTITNILTPDRDGNLEDIVLGFDNITDYEEKSPYFGSIIGRVAGRISNAEVQIDENIYRLSRNNGKNNLHGGFRGFDKVIWNVKEIVTQDYIGLELSYFSKDKEEGFPGSLSVKVMYLLNNNNELDIQYRGVSDKKTLINLTNHTYFNLSGNLKEDVLNHKITINADKIAFVDSDIIPTGELVRVKNSVFDFTKGKKVGKDIGKEVDQLLNCGGYDHPFILNKNCGFAVELDDQKSGRAMKIITDQPVVVFYSGNQISEDLVLRGNTRAKKHSGLCLETQDYPDSINQKNFPTKIYNPGETYTASSKYRFYVK